MKAEFFKIGSVLVLCVISGLVLGILLPSIYSLEQVSAKTDLSENGKKFLLIPD